MSTARPVETARRGGLTGEPAVARLVRSSSFLRFHRSSSGFIHVVRVSQISQVLQALQVLQIFGGIVMSYTEVPGVRVPIRMWADPATVEGEAMRQLRNVSSLPWIKGLAVM